MPAPKLGKFDRATTRAAGRLIDTWTYSCGLPGYGPLEVRVNLTTPREGVYVFVAHCPAFAAPIEDVNLNAIRAKADELLRDWCTDRSSLVWEDWLEVLVSGRVKNQEQVTAMALSIEYRAVPRAVLPDGSAVTVNAWGRVVPFPKPHQASLKIDPDELVFDERTSGNEISYIPATPAALVSLQQLQARLNQLRVSLSEMLTQSAIEERLLTLPKQPLALPDQVSPP